MQEFRYIILIYVIYIIGKLTCSFLGCALSFVYFSWRSRVFVSSKSISVLEGLRNDERTAKKQIANFLNGLFLRQIVDIGNIKSHTIRMFFYKYIYKVKIGKNVVIYGRSEFRDPYKIKIGNGSIIGDRVTLDARNGIEIGENANLSTGVWIWTEQHDYNSPYFSCNNKGGKVIIGDRAWVSCRTIILPGVKIGEGAVVAAGAVVTTNVPAYCIYGGVPAKKIGERNRELGYNFHGECVDFF